MSFQRIAETGEVALDLVRRVGLAAVLRDAFVGVSRRAYACNE
jgi:hypothetical protein